MTRRRTMGFKPSLNDQKRASLQAQQAMAHPGMSDAAKRHLAEFAATVKPKISRPRKPSLLLTESEVQRAIIGYLCGHPNVALVIRFNSGAVQSDKYYVEFSHIYSRGFNGERLRLPDIYALMRDGRTLNVEVKRGDWRGVSNQREIEQENYLRHVRACGGIGIFATCIEDVAVALTAAGY